MVNRKITGLIFISLLLHSAVLAQHKAGITAAGGASRLLTKAAFGGPPAQQNFYYRPSLQAGFSYSYSFKKYKIAADILYNQVNGREIDFFPETDENGNPTAMNIKLTVNREISYLGIPVYFGYSIKKLTVNLGIQTSIKLAGKDNTTDEAPYQGTLLVFKSSSKKLPVQDYDIGARLGLSYAFTKRIELMGMYYYGLTNINRSFPNDLNWKIRQFLIGINYSCMVKERRKSIAP